MKMSLLGITLVFLCAGSQSFANKKWTGTQGTQKYTVNQLMKKPARYLSDDERSFLWSQSQSIRKELCQNIVEWEKAGNKAVIETRQKFLICKHDSLGMELDNFFEVLKLEMSAAELAELDIKEKAKRAKRSNRMVIKATQVY